MDAKDLRIGNYVQLYGKQVQVLEIWDTALKTTDINTNCAYFIDQYSSIPLTEEILFKCGFYYDTDYLTFCIPTCTIQLDDYGSEGYMCVIFGEDLYLIYNLHQLQNLYYVLTGKELKYNE